MKKQFYSLILMLLIAISGSAQVINAPNVESVYGGRITGIAGYSRTSDSSRIFCSTESANSVFYTDVATPATSKSNFATWKVMPTLNADANLGYISNMAVHSTSGKLFFTYGNNLYSTDVNATSNTVVASAGPYNQVMIKGNYIYYVNGGQFHFGTLDASGNLTESVGSPVSFAGGAMNRICINPANNLIYFFVEGRSGVSPKLYVSNTAYTACSGATTFSDISPTTLSTSVDWIAFGIAPSGRLFIGGHYNTLVTSKYVAYSDDNSVSWTSYNSGISGVSGQVFDFQGSASSYYVYYSKMYNNNLGANGSWYDFGTPGGIQTHPNDGAVLMDPNDTNVVYMTTDQGIGASYDRGATIFEIDNGVEAVQVCDFVMTSDKNTAWIASKAGIRKVSNYQSTKTWTDAEWPQGDGSPYYSVDQNYNDSNNVYVGNVRIYKTTNSGSSWNRKFSPEDAPYGWVGVGYHFEAIKVCPWNSNIVVAGAYTEGSTYGGLFYSNDGGNNWSQQYLFASSGTHDADVFDIEFNLEGTDTIAYVGVEWGGGPGVPWSIYKLTRSGTAWTVSNDMQIPHTSTGAPIVVTINDIALSSTRDTVYACGIDAGGVHPVAYYKVLSGAAVWTPFTFNGLPSNGIAAKSMTLGHDTVYMAIGSDIYYLPAGASSWYLGYSYPVGTQINFLYYDDLLVGTGTGLYGHQSMKSNLKIVNQPQSISKCLNGNAYFEAISNGNGNINYQWRKNGVNISGANLNILVIQGLSYADTGVYSCVVSSNTGLSVTSNDARLSIASPTLISANPLSTATVSGADVTFGVNASGSSLTYQWYKNANAISGATTNALTIRNVQNADLGNYNVKVNGTCGYQISGVATLSLSYITINGQPQSLTRCEGTNATFYAYAFGSGTLSYQWKKDGVNISGATSNILSLSNLSTANTGNYVCQISNSNGTVTQTNSANLTVNQNIVINSNPSSKAAQTGANLTLNVAAIGSSLSYQWRKNGNDISGATANSLVLNNIQAADFANYNVKISGTCGSAISAMATISQAYITINGQPQSLTRCEGTNATFYAYAFGSGTLSYQWKKDGVNISGANANQLLLTNVSTSQSGNYSCEISSNNGVVVNSNSASLTVSSEVAINGHPSNQTSVFGGSATFNVAAIGSNLTYQWRKNGVDISGANSSSLSLSNLQNADFSLYNVKVSGTCGSQVSAIAKLTQSFVTINQQANSTSRCAGSNVSFVIYAYGSGTISYQWRKNGSDISGATSNVLSLSSISSSDAASYTCLVSSSTGASTLSNAAVLTVNDNTQINSSPSSQSVIVGNAINLSVGAVGSGLTYQWRKLSGNTVTNISGATSSTYSIPSANLSDAGLYNVRVIGTCGATNSGVAVVSVSLFKNASGIDEMESNNIVLYPVPCIDELNISIGNIPESNYDLTIIDMAGKLIYQSNLNVNSWNQLLTINTSSWSNGMYQVVCRDTQSNKHFSKKFIK